MTKKLIIIGNGGHASVLADIVGWDVARHESNNEILGFDPHKVELVLGVGPRSLRRKLVKLFTGRGYTFKTVISPHAHVAGLCEICGGAQIMAGAVIQPGTHIGDHAIINTNASVDHDCFIGDFAHIGPGAILCGNVTVEEQIMVKAGETIHQGRTVRRVRYRTEC